MAKKVGVGGVFSFVVALVGLLASVGPATQVVRDAIGVIWPAVLVGILSVICLVESLLLWRLQRPRGEEVDGNEVPLMETEQRETAYEAVLAAAEPYINAHRGMPDLSEPHDIYLPELEEAERAVDTANQNFVAARQLIEQHGSRSVLEATLRLEDAVNAGDLNLAAQIRRKDLVPAIRADRNLSSSDPAESQADRELKSAIDNLLDEMATIHRRLTDAINASFYGYKFFLPSAAYVKDRDVIGLRSSEAREVLREVYVQADALNSETPGGTSDGIALEYVRTDAPHLLEAVSRAQRMLLDLRP